MKTYQEHDFSQVPSLSVGRSQFQMPGQHTTTFVAGKIIPVYWEEVLPSDTFNFNMHCLCRLASPLKFPILDNLYLDLHAYWVPNRLVWPHWREFLGHRHKKLTTAEPTYLVPQVAFDAESSGVAPCSIYDYYGVPPLVNNIMFQSLPMRGYNLIWNEYYKDQNLQDDVELYDEDYPDGPDDEGLFTLLSRGKRHDYFTSATPTPQRGPGVPIPLIGTAPVYGTGYALGLTQMGSGTTTRFGTVALGDGIAAYSTAFGTTLGSSHSVSTHPNNEQSIGLVQKSQVGSSPANSGLYTDLSATYAGTINDLRLAIATQQFNESDMLHGTRYNELIHNHFGVTVPDFTCQRPEFLAGATIPININSVYSNETQGGIYAGTPAAYGISNGSLSFVKSFNEHGYVHVFASVRADLKYQQGLHRSLSRMTKFDYYWPEFAHLGEQSILNKEIFLQGTTADTETFGYIGRYDEYRYGKKMITGIFRSTDSHTLDYMHLSEEFGSAPALNSTFIIDDCKLRIDRVSQIAGSDTVPQFYFDSVVRLIAARCMPMYALPGLGRL